MDGRQAALLGVMVAVFLLAYFVPFEKLPAEATMPRSVREALLMLQDYAHHHVLLCLVPALFIAGAVSVFVSQAAVMKYFGAAAHKVVAYSVASVSGTILAACSCTILPLFAGIYKRGAGLGPATAFLYSGPAINILAIILTARVLGWEFGLARAVTAVLLSVLIGLAMHLIYRKEERARAAGEELVYPDEQSSRPLRQDALYFAAMIGVLVFANWSKLSEEGLAAVIWSVKWYLAGACLLLLIWMAVSWFVLGEVREWFGSTWGFAKQAVESLGLDAEVVKITDIMHITALGVLMTPALVVDGAVKSSGRVLPPERICELLS